MKQAVRQPKRIELWPMNLSFFCFFCLLRTFHPVKVLLAVTINVVSSLFVFQGKRAACFCPICLPFLCCIYILLVKGESYRLSIFFLSSRCYVLSSSSQKASRMRQTKDRNCAERLRFEWKRKAKCNTHCKL